MAGFCGSEKSLCCFRVGTLGLHKLAGCFLHLLRDEMRILINNAIDNASNTLSNV